MISSGIFQFDADDVQSSRVIDICEGVGGTQRNVKRISSGLERLAHKPELPGTCFYC